MLCYIHIYIDVCICMYVYIYIYTYIGVRAVPGAPLHGGQGAHAIIKRYDYHYYYY